VTLPESNFAIWTKESNGRISSSIQMIFAVTNGSGPLVVGSVMVEQILDFFVTAGPE